jgi:hypothetical protein
MDGGISIELADDAAHAGSRIVYELAGAQFGRYLPPRHRYLLLDTDPAEPDWLAITGNIGAGPSDPCTHALLPTFTRPFPGAMAELDRWYTDHHVPEVTAVEGFVTGRRFAHRDPEADHPRLALYELDLEDPGASLERLTAALPAMVQTDALDGSSIASWLFVPAEA